MSDKLRARIMDGIWVALVYLFLSVATDWHSFSTAELAKSNIGGCVLQSCFVGLGFGLFFRPMFNAASRQYARRKREKIPQNSGPSGGDSR